MADELLLRRAFDACKIFKGFYDDQAKNIPLKREVLGRGAVFGLKVAAKSQERFVTTLVDSAATVGLASTDAEAATVTFTGRGGRRRASRAGRDTSRDRRYATRHLGWDRHDPGATDHVERTCVAAPGVAHGHRGDRLGDPFDCTPVRVRVRLGGAGRAGRRRPGRLHRAGCSDR